MQKQRLCHHKVHAASRASSFCAIWSWGWDSNQHRYVLRYNLVLSRRPVFFFSNNTKDINCRPWKSFTQCHSLQIGCGPLPTARPSTPWCHRWLPCHIVNFLGSIPHCWGRSNRLNWSRIPGQAEHPRRAEDLCWSGGSRSCPCTGFDLLFVCNMDYLDSFVM